ncbi:MAG: PEGA domain-containing protein [Kofleriaceae bacterium]
MKALAALLFVTAIAQADGRSDAETYFHYGEQAWKAQNFAAAAEQFERAYKAAPLPELAFSAAQAYRRQYQVDQKAANVTRAIELYRAYLDKVHVGGRVADASDALRELQAELERLIKSGVKVAPEIAAEHTQLGVDVILDGEKPHTNMREIEDTPADPAVKITATLDGAVVQPYAMTNVVPGKHAIHVEVAGYDPLDKSVEVAPGDYRMVDAPMHAKPAHLAVTTPARIAIDGRFAGDAPTSVDVAAGKHLVALLHDGREPWEQELVLARGQDLKLSPELEVTAKRRWAGRIAFAGGITGLLALGAMPVALVEDSHASSLHDKFTQFGNASPADEMDFNTSVHRRNLAVDALWALGAMTVAAGVTSVVLYYTDSPQVAVRHSF